MASHCFAYSPCPVPMIVWPVCRPLSLTQMCVRSFILLDTQKSLKIYYLDLFLVHTHTTTQSCPHFWFTISTGWYRIHPLSLTRSLSRSQCQWLFNTNSFNRTTFGDHNAIFPFNCGEPWRKLLKIKSFLPPAHACHSMAETLHRSLIRRVGTLCSQKEGISFKQQLNMYFDLEHFIGIYECMLYFMS